MKVAFDYDNMDFIQFMWYYDRLKEQKEKELAGGNGTTNLLDDMESLKKFSGRG